MTSSAFDDSASVSTSHTVLVPFAKAAHKSSASIYKSYDLVNSVSELGELSTLDRRHSLSAVDLNPCGRRPLPITTSRPLSLGIGSLGSTVSRFLETLVRRTSLRPRLHQEDGFVHEASEFLESLQHMHGLCDMSPHIRDSTEPRSSQTFERGTRSGTQLDRTAEGVVEMAIEEANGACDICHRPLWDFGALESTTTEQDELLIRMMRMMGEHDPYTRYNVARFLTICALSHRVLRSTLLRLRLWSRAAMISLDCRRLRSLGNAEWADATVALQHLTVALGPEPPEIWYDIEQWNEHRWDSSLWQAYVKTLIGRMQTVGLMSDIACARMTALLRLSMSSGPGSKQGYCRRICVSFTPAAIRQAIAARRDPWDFVYALCVASAREFSADERITSHDLAVWVPVLSWLVQRDVPWFAEHSEGCQLALHEMNRAVAMAEPRRLLGPEEAALEALLPRLMILQHRCDHGRELSQVVYRLLAASVIVHAVGMFGSHRSARAYYHEYIYGYETSVPFGEWGVSLLHKLAAQVHIHRESPWAHRLAAVLRDLASEEQRSTSTQYSSKETLVETPGENQRAHNYDVLLIDSNSLHKVKS